MPSPEHEQMVAVLREANLTEAPSIEEQRANYEAMLAELPLPDDLSVEAVTIGPCTAEWVSVTESRADRVVLYLHGGGYVIGSSRAYREFASRVARANRCRVLVLDYRLAPEHPFPAAVEDTVAAYRWLLAGGTAPEQLAFAGDSAGGGLALAALMSLRDSGERLPAGAVLFSPWTDLEGTGASAVPGAVDDPLLALEALQGLGALYAGDALRNPLASPLHGDLTGLPPLQFQTGEREVLLDDTRRVVEKAQAARLAVETFLEPGLIHVWPVLVPGAPESETALARMARFTEAHWG